jgi:hypothetical protein
VFWVVCFYKGDTEVFGPFYAKPRGVFEYPGVSIEMKLFIGFFGFRFIGYSSEPDVMYNSVFIFLKDYI